MVPRYEMQHGFWCPSVYPRLRGCYRIPRTSQPVSHSLRHAVIVQRSLWHRSVLDRCDTAHGNPSLNRDAAIEWHTDSGIHLILIM